MDLIYTNANWADLGVLSAYSFDLSFGADENDFELTVGANEPVLEGGSVVYIEDTEYGGTVDGLKCSTKGDTMTYKGRTWHGILNSKIIQPDTGLDYFVVSGDAHEVIATVIARLGLSGLFEAAETSSGISVTNYKFNRYCKGYDGLCAMLAASGAKLKTVWKNRAVHLSAEAIADYSKDPVDGDVATLTVERYTKKVNHLICLGKGNLADREVIHLYVDHNGKIGNTQYYTGLDEYAVTYENSNVESSEELLKEGTSKLKELRDNDVSEMSMNENGKTYDIGDVVGSTEIKSGISVTATIAQKIVKINNGAVSIEYKTGG